MADSSSSEESSDEDEHDEDSPSHPDPVGSTSAARHPNRKKLRYFRDYLQRLPKHQRRRIKKEIKKGIKPGETCTNYHGSVLTYVFTRIMNKLVN